MTENSSVSGADGVLSIAVSSPANGTSLDDNALDEAIIALTALLAFPLLLYAPGGLKSRLDLWKESPANPDQPAAWMNPMQALADRFTVVCPDLRGYGESTGPAATNWVLLAAPVSRKRASV